MPGSRKSSTTKRSVDKPAVPRSLMASGVDSDATRHPSRRSSSKSPKASRREQSSPHHSRRNQDGSNSSDYNAAPNRSIGKLDWDTYRRTLREGTGAEYLAQVGLLGQPHGKRVMHTAAVNVDAAKPILKRPDSYTVLSREVQYELTKYFTETNCSPDARERAILLDHLTQNIDSRVSMQKLTRWFQNRRAYCKRLGI